MSYLQLLQLAAPEAIVVLTALAVLTVSLIAGRRAAGASIATRTSGITEARPGSKVAPELATLVAAVGLAIAATAVLRLPAHAVVGDGMLVISPLNSLFKLIVLALAFATVLLARSERSLAHTGEYLAIVLLATVGLMLLVGSEELLTIFIGLELTGLSLYVMTAFDKTRQSSAEAGLKYFLFGSTASAFMLFGLSLIYGLAGTTALAGIGARLSGGTLQPLLLVAIVMALIGFAFKIAVAPFHFWAPDAYQGAPATSAGFIASGSKVASFVVLGKIVLIGFQGMHGNASWHAMLAGWAPVLAVLSALSILVGNLAALAQKNVPRLLAYSAVAHGGYTLVGLIAASPSGFSATLFYTTIYAITLVGAFGVAGFVRRETGGDDLSDFAGLHHRAPMLAGCMAVFMLSLAGLPPLAGFFGKFYLFSVAIAADANHGLLWLVALALFGSLISLYYYLMVLKAVFVDESDRARLPLRSDALSRLTILLAAAATLFFGVYPSFLLSRILLALQ